MSATETPRAIDAVWRIESPKLIAALTRIVRDIATAEDLAHDVLVTALEQWPQTGIPQNPAAWLMAAGKRRAIDVIRRAKMIERKHAELGHDLDTESEMPDVDDVLDDDIGDDLLRLIFIACHPILSIDGRVALTLRLLGGLTTEEIARAFLVPAQTIAQRIVRAKKTLSKARISFDVPRGDERRARLSAVLEVVYLIFNEGYSATTGGDWMRPALCEDALRLGRVLAELVPDVAEVHGLVALMEIQASRANARTTADGTPILLLDQNRALWDQLLIRRGLAALARAAELGGVAGPYALQAAIAACHARARTAAETDWRGIVLLYELLATVMPSPIVELNHAVAVSMAFGPQAGLDLVDALTGDAKLQHYHLLASVRGDLLVKVGRAGEARAEFERAAAQTNNVRERELLLERASTCAALAPPS